MSEKMSLTRALAELKMLDKRIDGKTNESKFVDFLIGGETSTRVPVETLTSEIKGDLTSIEDLIERRRKIKSALTLANASTEVEIGNVKMKIAEAIDYKTFILSKKHLLNTMKSQYANVSAKIEQQNRRVEDKVADILSKDGDSKRKEEDANYHRSRYEAKIHDPLKIKEKIDALEKEISEFETTVDFKLSEVNSSTFIYI